MVNSMKTSINSEKKIGNFMLILNCGVETSSLRKDNKEIVSWEITSLRPRHLLEQQQYPEERKWCISLLFGQEIDDHSDWYPDMRKNVLQRGENVKQFLL